MIDRNIPIKKETVSQALELSRKTRLKINTEGERERVKFWGKSKVLEERKETIGLL